MQFVHVIESKNIFHECILSKKCIEVNSTSVERSKNMLHGRSSCQGRVFHSSSKWTGYLHVSAAVFPYLLLHQVQPTSCVLVGNFFVVPVKSGAVLHGQTNSCALIQLLVLNEAYGTLSMTELNFEEVSNCKNIIQEPSFRKSDKPGNTGLFAERKWRHLCYLDSSSYKNRLYSSGFKKKGVSPTM